MINRAIEGEEVIITRNGAEVATIEPVRKKKRSWIGMWKGQIELNDSLKEPVDDETLTFSTGGAETFLDKLIKKDVKSGEKE